jgi:hemerythrin
MKEEAAMKTNHIENKNEQEPVENHRDPEDIPVTRKILDWRQSTTGMSFFDGPTKEFIKITNQLYSENLVGGWSHSRKIFEETLRHALRYFQTAMRIEEKIMEKISYPDYQRHKSEHILFLKEIYRQVERYKANQDIDVKAFVLFLRDWVLSHMGVTDRSFVFYLTWLKREGQLVKIILQMKRMADNRLLNEE